MACIKLCGPLGERIIAENENYRLFKGEAICATLWDCNRSSSSDVNTELAKQGLKIGDAIAWATKKIGIKQCAPCKARQEILNNVEKVGWVEAMKQIKATL